MGLVHAVGARGADAGVVGATVELQQALVFLAELLLQVERRLDEPVRGERLDLQKDDVMETMRSPFSGTTERV